MRRLLLTTALVCVAFAPAARAELDVTVGGYTGFQAGFFDNDSWTTERDFQSESEIHVKANATTDGGLKYGAYVEMQASTSDSVSTDETNLYLEGNWGRLELGDQDGAGSVMAVQTPDVGIGQVNGSYNDFVPAADRGYRNGEAGGDSFLKPMDTSDTTKITYYSPKWEGVQVGVSYAPERDSLADGEGVQTSDTTGNHDNAIELGLNYAREFNGISLKLSGEYNHADAKTSAVEEISAWGFGGQIGYQGFAFGGTYYDNGDSGLATGTTDDEVQGYALGLSYKTDNWGVAASFAQVDFDQNATPFEVTGATGSGGEYTVYGVGGSYKLAPGLTAGADLMFFDRNRDTGTDTDGYVLVTEVKAAF